MKNILSFFIVIIVIALFSFSIGEPLPIGSTMPKADLKMKDVSGKKVSIKKAMEDKGVLVIFSCNTCPYVIKNEQRIFEICEYAQKMDLGVIVINSNEAYRKDDDSYDAMKKYAASHNYKWAYVVDEKSEMADAFGAKRTPECFLFNNKSVLVYHGAIDDNPADENAVTKTYLKEAITALSSGKDIEIKESKSVGCAIKRVKKPL